MTDTNTIECKGKSVNGVVVAMAKKSVILIIEDNKALNKEIASCLSASDFDTFSAHSGKEADSILASQSLDLILLDLQLPDIKGSVLCQKIKKHHNIPVVVLTGSQNEVDKIHLLELGADNYLVKPISSRVLLSYVQAMIRLNKNSHQEPKDVVTNTQCLEFDRFSLNLATKTLSSGDDPIDLTCAEYLLLRTLLQKPRHVLSRDQLISSSNEHSDAFNRSIDILISRLRKKIEDNSRKPKIIKTIRGIGYVLDVPVTKRTVQCGE